MATRVASQGIVAGDRGAVFLPVEMAPDGAAAVEPVDEATCEITIVLRNALQSQCRGMIGDVALARLVRVLETT